MSIYDSIKFGELTSIEYQNLKDYGNLYTIYPQASGNYHADMLRERMRDSDFVEKIEALYEPEKDNMFVDNYIPCDERVAMELEVIVNDINNIIKNLKGE